MRGNLWRRKHKKTKWVTQLKHQTRGIYEEENIRKTNGSHNLNKSINTIEL